MRRIDGPNWPRGGHYAHFRTFQNPWFQIAARIQVGGLVRWARAKHVSLSRTLVWAATRAANSVPELRHRIRGDQVVEHEVVHPSFTILRAAECDVLAHVGDRVTDDDVRHTPAG